MDSLKNVCSSGFRLKKVLFPGYLLFLSGIKLRKIIEKNMPVCQYAPTYVKKERLLSPLQLYEIKTYCTNNGLRRVFIQPVGSPYIGPENPCRSYV